MPFKRTSSLPDIASRDTGHRAWIISVVVHARRVGEIVLLFWLCRDRQDGREKESSPRSARALDAASPFPHFERRNKRVISMRSAPDVCRTPETSRRRTADGLVIK